MAGRLAAALIVLALIGAAAVWLAAGGLGPGAPSPVGRGSVGRVAIGCRAVGVGARAFGVDPSAIAVAVAVTRGPAAVRVGLDPDGVVRGAGAVLTAARPDAAEPQARSRRPSNASSAATCSADSGIGLSVS